MSSPDPQSTQPVVRENILGSRKTANYIIMVLSILANVWLSAHTHVPIEIAIAGMWTIALGGLYTIGGQSLVDSIAKWKSGPIPTDPVK